MSRLVALLACVLFGLLATSAPAMAHEESGGSPVASDARSVVVSSDLPRGVTLDVLQNGLALRVRNASPTAVSVLETAGSPPLRVPPGGTVQWHLDAAHPDPEVGSRPWRVLVDDGGAVHEVRGEVRWTPGPAPWPWLAGAAVLALAVATALCHLGHGRPGRGRPGRAWLLAVPLGFAVVVSIVHTGAALAARTAEGSRLALLGDYLPQAGCWALGALAVVLLARGRRDGQGLGALAAVGLVLVTLVRDGAVLGAATVLVALPAGLDRLAVTTVLGLAAGMVIALPLLTRRHHAAQSVSPSSL